MATQTGSQCFLALDYIQYDEAQATTTVSLDSASPDYPSSLQSGVTSNSYGGGEAHQDNGDSSNLSAIIGELAAPLPMLTNQSKLIAAPLSVDNRRCSGRWCRPVVVHLCRNRPLAFVAQTERSL